MCWLLKFSTAARLWELGAAATFQLCAASLDTGLGAMTQTYTGYTSSQHFSLRLLPRVCLVSASKDFSF